MNSCAVSHPIPPVCDSHSRILILGSFPSVKSRENGFFYGHSRNRFWKTVSTVIGRPEPKSIEEKKKMLLDSGIALWDVIASCEISASSDSSIKNAVPNDPEKPFVTSGARLGTPMVTSRGMGPAEMEQIADCIWRTATEYPASAEEVKRTVASITARYPAY